MISNKKILIITFLIILIIIYRHLFFSVKINNKLTYLNGKGCDNNPKKINQKNKILSFAGGGLRALTVHTGVIKGITKKLSIKRNILAGNPITCSMCNGSGMRVQIHQMGGMIQQIQSRCNNCNGRGISVNKVQESNVVHVEIESGSKTGDHILLKNMGDQNIDKSYNNIIIEVNENKHTVYSRKHNDLYMQYKINLAESLLGTEINFIHINGQEKFIHMPQTNVIKPYSIYRIPGEGMPIRKSNEYGDLLIKFNVVFPDSISKDDIEKLQKVFNYTPVFNTSNTSLIAFVDDTANDDFINNNDDSKNNSNEFNEEEPPGCRTS